MLDTVKVLVNQNAKAIVAFVVSAVVSLAISNGIDVPSDVVLTLQAFVVAVVVWLVRNK